MDASLTLETRNWRYRPTQFKQMLDGQGGDATVRQLLAKGKPSEGFTRLWELGRLDLTVEGLVVETKWRPLIDPILVQQAERLLTQSKYRFTPFAGAAAVGGVAQSSVASLATCTQRLASAGTSMRISSWC